MSTARFLRVGMVVVFAVVAGAIGFAFAGGGIDVVDETIIDAPPLAVYDAILDEAAGRTSWWSPYWQAEARDGDPPDRVGAVFTASVRAPGADRTLRVVCRTVELVPGRLIRIEYIEGAFIGEGAFTLEPDGGRTRVSFRFTARPTRWLLRLLAPAVRKRHSAVMRAGFEGLAAHMRSIGTPAS